MPHWISGTILAIVDYIQGLFGFKDTPRFDFAIFSFGIILIMIILIFFKQWARALVEFIRGLLTRTFKN